MIKLFKRIRSQIKYTNCDIPAILFFDELMHGNISVLGKGTPEQLNNAYWGIIDEYCELSGNFKMKSWFEKQEKVSNIQRAISDVNVCINNIILASQIATHKEQIVPFIDAINKLEFPKVRFSYTKPLHEEVERVRKSVIGVLNNQLKIELGNEQKKKEAIKKDFMARIVNIQNIIGRNLDDNISLRKFIYEEKSAHDKVNASKNKR